MNRGMPCYLYFVIVSTVKTRQWSRVGAYFCVFLLSANRQSTLLAVLLDEFCLTSINLLCSAESPGPAAHWERTSTSRCTDIITSVDSKNLASDINQPSKLTRQSNSRYVVSIRFWRYKIA